MTSQSVKNAVVINAAFIQQVIDGALNGASSVADAQAALEAAKGKLLPSLLLTLKGAPKVTEADWAKDWAAPTLAAYVAKATDRTVAKGENADPAKMLLAGRAPTSKLKVCVIAITNGVEPLASEDLFGFTERARNVCKTRGLIKGEAKSPKARTSTKSPKSEAKAKQSVEDHALAFAMNDKAFADKLILVAADYRPQFEAWFDMLMTMASVKAA